MKIGDVAVLLNTSVQTLRFYENNGLIQSKRTEGGTRFYDDEDIDRIKVIQTLSALGIPHKQLKQLADTRLLSKTGDESSHKVVIQLNDIKETLVHLKSLVNKTITDIKKAESFVEQCYGCRKKPRKNICAQCDVSQNIKYSNVINLVWDQ